MPAFLGFTKFNLVEYGEASNRFHLAYGIALSKWAAIEERMFLWFFFITGMKQDMARAIFYSARNFTARADMLSQAVAVCHLTEDEKEFLRAATKKSHQFSAFRNSIVHGEPTFDVREGSPTYKQFIHLQGDKHPAIAADSALTIQHLERSAARFSELSRLLGDVLEHMHSLSDMSIPSECLRQVKALPNDPSSAEPAPTPVKRPRRRQS